MSQADMAVHSTGAKRSTEADGYRYDLIAPLYLRGIAKTLHEGAEKYGDRNWCKGFSFSDIIKHLMTHIEKYRAGDTTEDHISHAACNLMFLKEFEVTHPELDDRYKQPWVFGKQATPFNDIPKPTPKPGVPGPENTQIGDWVVCTDNAEYEKPLTKGKSYKVCGVESPYVEVIENFGNRGRYLMSRFTLLRFCGITKDSQGR